jgi:hypothetical protein
MLLLLAISNMNITALLLASAAKHLVLTSSVPDQQGKTRLYSVVFHQFRTVSHAIEQVGISKEPTSGYVG